MECDPPRHHDRYYPFRFNPRTPCGVRPFSFICTLQAMRVSIHALRVECDLRNSGRRARRSRFNPRTPCGVRLSFLVPFTSMLLFQSTHSVWSATVDTPQGLERELFQSTHSVWSATRKVFILSDCKRFQSTHSVWSATVSLLLARDAQKCFNPRTPCGVRLPSLYQGLWIFQFQSTHSVWSATHRGLYLFLLLTMFQSTHSVWSATGTPIISQRLF